MHRYYIIQQNTIYRVPGSDIRAFDVGDFQAVGQIINQVYKRIAYESIIETGPPASGHRGDD